MVIDAAEVILLIAAAYSALGVAVGLAFVATGVDAVDASAAHAPWSFRLIVLPGAVALWPIVLRWWLLGKGGRQ